MPPRRTSSSRSRASAPVAPMPSAPEMPSRPARASGGPSPFALIVVLLVLVTAAALAFRNMLVPSGGSSQTQNAAPGSTDDVNALVARVGRHIVVNVNEVPTVATIEDASVLRAQSPSFYADAQNGDRLLVWSDKAVLYSPSRDLLLAVMPVSLPPPSASSTSMTPTTTSTAETVEQATIEVRNGTRTSGLGRQMVDKLKAVGLTVLPATDARLKTYEKTVIIVKDASTPFPKTLQKIQEITNAEVVPASLEEGALKGDIVVIVGADAVQ